MILFYFDPQHYMT